MHEAKDWTEALVKELKESGEVLPGGYVNFMGTEESTEGCFGDNWERMKELKRRVDGGNVFEFAQPLLLKGEEIQLKN